MALFKSLGDVVSHRSVERVRAAADDLDRAILDTSHDGQERVVPVRLHPDSPVRPYEMVGLTVLIRFEDRPEGQVAIVRKRA